MQIKDILGWASSGVLLLTLGKQIYKQWTDPNVEGVSKWLFLGQMVSGIGFVIYSVMVDNLVFVVTNSLLLIENILGLILLKRKQRQTATAE